MYLRRFLFLLFACCALGLPLVAQNNPQSIAAANACAKFDVTGLSTLGIQVTGTWTATLQPEVAIAGQSAVNTQVTPSTSSTAQSTISANGIYYANVAGASTFLLCASAYTSGTASVWFQGSSKVNASLFGGGGGGTVTSVSGTANQINSTGGATPVLSLPSAITLPGTVNKLTLTAPATGATLTLANNKTFTVNNTLTLAGTDGTTMTFPATSATLARTDAGNTFTGHQTIEGVTSTGATGTGNLIFATSPTLTTPALGTPSAIVLTNATGFPAAIVETGQTNVYGAFLQDFSSATMEVPEGAGFTTNVDSAIGNDTTNNNIHLWENSADSIAVVEAAAIAANTLPKATDSTHGLLTASLLTDNGTTLAYSGTGGLSGPNYVASGTGAGMFSCTQGTAQSAPTNGFGLMCPTAIATGYIWTAPSGQAAAAGALLVSTGGVLSYSTLSNPATTVLATSTGALTNGHLASIANTSGDYGDSGITATAYPVADLATSGTWAFAGTLSGAFTASGNPAFTGTPTFSNALALGSSTLTTQATGDNSTKGATTAYVQKEQQSTWTCHESQALSSALGASSCQWTLPVAMTITGFEGYAVVASNTCTTYPVVSIYDNNAAAIVGSYSLTLGNGTHALTQVTGTTSVVAGHVLQLRITTALNTCTGSPSGLDVTVTYQPQT